MPVYNGYVENLSRRIEARLTDIEAVYNFELGSEFEVAVCHLLSEILPTKFGVCRGFVVTMDGQIAGDDLIIFDRHSCPTLRSTTMGDFSIKEQIPVEGVYAYIECKHSIDNEATLDRAIEQVNNVKGLMFTRRPKLNDRYEELGPVYNRKIRDWPRTFPKLRNQPFAVVFARQSDYCFTFSKKVAERDPDLIVLGADKIATQSVMLGADGIKGSLFLDDKHWAAFRTELLPQRAFGVFVLHLLAAINWISLDPIDWVEQLNKSL